MLLPLTTCPCTWQTMSIGLLLARAWTFSGGALSQQTFQRCRIISDRLCVVEAVDNSSCIEVIGLRVVDEVAEPDASERAVDHAKRQDVIGGGRVEGPLRVVQKLIAKIQVLAHLLVVAFPGKLRVAPTVVGIYIGVAVAVC